MLRLLASTLLLTVGTVAARSYTFNVVDANVNPDGFERAAVTIDGSFAPLITVNRYDEIKVKVNNQLSNPAMLKGTSIVSTIIVSCAFWYLSTIWPQSTGMESSNVGTPKWMVKFLIRQCTLFSRLIIYI